jgi:hypothetical protein
MRGVMESAGKQQGTGKADHSSIARRHNGYKELLCGAVAEG